MIRSLEGLQSRIPWQADLPRKVLINLPAGKGRYALNDPVANIDKDGLGVLPAVTVVAKAVHRMSAFSQFTSKILGTATLAEKI
jgi:hypothetical protein